MAVIISTALRQFGCDSGFNSAFDATGILELHDGTRPQNADQTATGTNILASITLPPNVFADPSTAGVMTNSAPFTTAGALQSGTTTWGRMKLSADSGQTGTTDRRLDFSVGTSGADMNLTTTAIVSGNPVTINSMTITMPNQ